MVTILANVQDRIDLVEARLRDQARADHPELRAALSHLLASGGKRIRPAVTLLAGNIFGADPDNLVTLAAAIELLHTATLVHDDLIDGSLLRRGTPTLNSQWSPAATVLTGDFIFAKAAKLAAETTSVDVMRMFADTLNTIVNGEIHQLFDGRGRLDRQEYFKRIYAKTASMFELAAGAAALLAGQDAEMIATAQSFGHEIGVAFQIVDDVLDFTGKQTTVGKPVANDLRQGLVTLPTLHYHAAVPEDPVLEKVLRGKSVAPEKINGLIEAIRESGSIEAALEEARKYLGRAREILERFPEHPERQALDDLAVYMVERSN